MQARSELTEMCVLLRTSIAAIGVTWTTGVKSNKCSICSMENLLLLVFCVWSLKIDTFS